MRLVTLLTGVSLTSTTPSNGAKPPTAYSFETLPGGVVRLTMNARLMHLDDARPLCGDIEGAAASDAIRLVVDVGRVSLATPAAAFHGLRTLRHVRIASIALVHTSPAIRRVATLMLRAAGFGRFGFFDDEDAAVAWLQQESDVQPEASPQSGPPASPRTAPTPSRRRRAAAAAAGATAAALAGGIAAVRRRSRHRRRGRAPRRDPPRRARRTPR